MLKCILDSELERTLYIDNSLFTGGVNRIFWWSGQAECINYDSDNEEIGCAMDEYGYFTANTSGHLISFKENN